jgi:hypothetical protein
MAKSIHDYVVDSLRENRKSLSLISASTRISEWTLLKIMYRQIKNPGIKSVEPLYRYFKDREGAQLRNRRSA